LTVPKGTWYNIHIIPQKEKNMPRKVREQINIFKGIVEHLENTYKDRNIKIREWETNTLGTIDFYLDGNRYQVFRLALGQRANPDESGIKI